jgi:hypothetical protein
MPRRHPPPLYPNLPITPNPPHHIPTPFPCIISITPYTRRRRGLRRNSSRHRLHDAILILLMPPVHAKRQQTHPGGVFSSRFALPTQAGQVSFTTVYFIYCSVVILLYVLYSAF